MFLTGFEPWSNQWREGINERKTGLQGHSAEVVFRDIREDSGSPARVRYSPGNCLFLLLEEVSSQSRGEYRNISDPLNDALPVGVYQTSIVVPEHSSETHTVSSHVLLRRKTGRTEESRLALKPLRLSHRHPLCFFSSFTWSGEPSLF